MTFRRVGERQKLYVLVNAQIYGYTGPDPKLHVAAKLTKVPEFLRCKWPQIAPFTPKIVSNIFRNH